jgi:hypothetical protein
MVDTKIALFSVGFGKNDGHSDLFHLGQIAGIWPSIGAEEEVTAQEQIKV